jgi:hypothetical protein
MTLTVSAALTQAWHRSGTRPRGHHQTDQLAARIWVGAKLGVFAV